MVMQIKLIVVIVVVLTGLMTKLGNHYPGVQFLKGLINVNPGFKILSHSTL